MSENWVSKQDLHDFYMKILPYLGSASVDIHTGFTPVGTIIPFMGVIAPQNYLACDGQIVNVADYPDLADFFEVQFGTKYKFGGSGTTFGIPDLRGEFLRGTGSNSHADNGDGANVGVHQDATSIPQFWDTGTSTQVRGQSGVQTPIQNSDWSGSTATGTIITNTLNGSRATGGSSNTFTTRPTNTSVLYCIAVRDIYIEQVGGCPVGGTSGASLVKASNSDYDFQWAFPCITRGTQIVGQNVHVTSTETVVNVPTSGSDLIKSLPRSVYFIAIFGSGNNSLVQQLAWLMNSETASGSGRRYSQKIFLGTHWCTIGFSTDYTKLYLTSDSTATNIDELYFRELRLVQAAY